MGNLIGRKVLLKKSYAKWYLDHPEVYESPTFDAYEDPEYEVETLLHLMCLMDVPIYGKIIYSGCDVWGVEFRQGKYKMFYYVQLPRHAELV